MTAQHPAAPETRGRPEMLETARTSEPKYEDLPTGTAVLAFPGSRRGRAIVTTTRSKPWTLPCGERVVMVEGYAGGIAMSHIEVMPDPMTAQHPAAPETETDANGLTEAERHEIVKALHDFPHAGVKWLMFRNGVYAAVERIVAERVRVVEGERDAARGDLVFSRQTTTNVMEALADSGAETLAAIARAESAEAQLRVVEGERDAARTACASYEGCDRAAEVEAAHGRALVDLADARDHAESAEAAHEAEKAARNALTRALTRAHGNGKKQPLPTIPIGTRVRLTGSPSGVGTVVGRDGYGFDGVAVIFDEPAPRGFEDGCCTGVEQVEILGGGEAQ